MVGHSLTRLDGLPFHDFMMAENARSGSVFGALDIEASEADKPRTLRFGKPHISTTASAPSPAIPCSQHSAGQGVRVNAHNGAG
jgi:hypothetical protein